MKMGFKMKILVYMFFNFRFLSTGFHSVSEFSQVCYGVSTGVRKQTFSSFCTIL